MEEYVQLPHNKDAEEVLLSAAIHDRITLLTLIDRLQESDFFTATNQILFSVITSLETSGSTVSLLTIEDKLKSTGQLQVIGGIEIIERIDALGASTDDVPACLTIVERDGTRRRFHKVGRDILEHSLADTDPDDLISDVNNLVTEASHRGTGGFVSAAKAASEYFDTLVEWQENPLAPGDVRGLRTYMPSIDRLIAGMLPGEEYVVCGRPGSGKSSIAFEVALLMALNGHRVLIFSLEMKHRAIVARWASRNSGVQTQRIKRGIYNGVGEPSLYVTEEEFSSYTQAAVELMGQENILIDDSGSLTMPQLRSRAIRKAREVGDVDFIICDHGGLLHSTGNGYENSAQVEGRKVRAFRELLGELGCPGFLLWQLNRQVEMRTDRRPMLSDLRNTGEVEEHADGVLGLYRDEYYNRDTVHRNVLEVLSLKLRDGEMGRRARLYYNASLSHFGELTQQEDQVGW